MRAEGRIASVGPSYLTSPSPSPLGPSPGGQEGDSRAGPGTHSDFQMGVDSRNHRHLLWLYHGTGQQRVDAWFVEALEALGSSGSPGRRVRPLSQHFCVCWPSWMPGRWMGAAQTDTMMIKMPKEELDEGILSWICDRSGSICRTFTRKWVSGLRLVLVEDCWAELILQIYKGSLPVTPVG